jgi:hypothetical protein
MDLLLDYLVCVINIEWLRGGRLRRKKRGDAKFTPDGSFHGNLKQ